MEKASPRSTIICVSIAGKDQLVILFICRTSTICTCFISIVVVSITSSLSYVRFLATTLRHGSLLYEVFIKQCCRSHAAKQRGELPSSGTFSFAILRDSWDDLETVAVHQIKMVDVDLCYLMLSEIASRTRVFVS